MAASDYLRGIATSRAQGIDAANFGDTSGYGGTQDILVPSTQPLAPTVHTGGERPQVTAPTPIPTTPVETPTQAPTPLPNAPISDVFTPAPTPAGIKINGADATIKQIDTPKVAGIEQTESQRMGSQGISLTPEKFNQLARDDEGDFIYSNDRFDPLTVASVTGRQVATGALNSVDKMASAPDAIASGVVNLAANATGSDTLKAKAEDLAKASTKSLYDGNAALQEFMHDTDKFTSELPKSGQVIAGLGRSAGEQLPSMLLGNVVAGAASAAGASSAVVQGLAQASSLGSMYGRVYAGELDSMMSQGFDLDTASKKAFAAATIEVGTEMLTGGVPGVPGSGILDNAYGNLVESMVSKSTLPLGMLGQSQLSRAGIAFAQSTAGVWNFLNSEAGEVVADLVGEGVEEWISEFVTPYVDRQFVGLNTPNSTRGERALAFLTGSLMGAFFEAGSIINTAENYAFRRADAIGDVMWGSNLSGEAAAFNPSTGKQYSSMRLSIDPETNQYIVYNANTRQEVKRYSAEQLFDASYKVSPKNQAETVKAQAAEDAMNRMAQVDINGMTQEQRQMYVKVMLMNQGITMGFNPEIIEAIGLDPSDVSVSKLPIEFWPEQLLEYTSTITDADIEQYRANVLQPAIDTWIKAASDARLNPATQQELRAELQNTVLPNDVKITRNWITDEAITAYKKAHAKEVKGKTKSEVREMIAAEMNASAEDPKAWAAATQGKLKMDAVIKDMVSKKDGTAKAIEIFGQDAVQNYFRQQISSKFDKSNGAVIMTANGAVNFTTLAEDHFGKALSDLTEAELAQAATVFDKLLEQTRQDLEKTLETFAPQLDKYGLSAEVMSDEQLLKNPNRVAEVDHVNNVIRYNPRLIRTQSAAVVTTVHELIHEALVQGGDTELQISNIVEDAMRSLGLSYEDAYNEISKQAEYKDLSDQLKRGEVDARFLGTALANKAGLEALSSANPDALREIIQFIGTTVDPNATDVLSQNQRVMASNIKDELNGSADVKAESQTAKTEDAAAIEEDAPFESLRMADGSKVPTYLQAFRIANSGNAVLDLFSVQYDTANERITLYADDTIKSFTKKGVRNPMKALGFKEQLSTTRKTTQGSKSYEYYIDDPVEARAMLSELAGYSGMDVTSLDYDTELNTQIEADVAADMAQYGGAGRYQESTEVYYTDENNKRLGKTFVDAVEAKYGKEVRDLYVAAREKMYATGGIKGTNLTPNDTLRQVLIDSGRLKAKNESTNGKRYEKTKNPQPINSVKHKVLNGLNMTYYFSSDTVYVSPATKGGLTDKQFSYLKTLGFKSSTTTKVDAEGSKVLGADGKPVREGNPNRWHLSGKDAETFWNEAGGPDLLSDELERKRIKPGMSYSSKEPPLILSPKQRKAEAHAKMQLQNIKEGVTETPYPGIPGVTIKRTFGMETSKGKVISGLILDIAEGSEASKGSYKYNQLKAAGWVERPVTDFTGSSKSYKATKTVLFHDWDVKIWDAALAGDDIAFTADLVKQQNLIDKLAQLKWYDYFPRGNGAIRMAVYDNEIILDVDFDKLGSKSERGKVLNQLYTDGQAEYGGKTQGGFKYNDALFPGVRKLYHQPFNAQVFEDFGGPKGATIEELLAANNNFTLDDIFENAEGNRVFIEAAPFTETSYRGYGYIKDGKVYYQNGEEANNGDRITMPKATAVRGISAYMYDRRSVDAGDVITEKGKGPRSKVEPLADSQLVVLMRDSDEPITIKFSEFDNYVSDPNVLSIVDSNNAVLYDASEVSETTVRNMVSNTYDSDIVVKFKGDAEAQRFGGDVLADYRYKDEDDDVFKMDPSVEWIQDASGKELYNASTNYLDDIFKELSETPQEDIMQTIGDVNAPQDKLEHTKQIDELNAEMAKTAPLRAIECEKYPDFDSWKIRYNPDEQTVELVKNKKSGALSSEAIAWAESIGFKPTTEAANVYAAKYKAGLFAQFGVADLIEERITRDRENQKAFKQGKLIKVYDDEGKPVFDKYGFQKYKASGGRETYANYGDISEEGIARYRDNNKRGTKYYNDAQVAGIMIGHRDGIDAVFFAEQNMQTRTISEDAQGNPNHMPYQMVDYTNGAELLAAYELYREGLADTSVKGETFKKAKTAFVKANPYFKKAKDIDIKTAMGLAVRNFNKELKKSNAFNESRDNLTLGAESLNTERTGVEFGENYNSSVLTDTEGNNITGDVAQMFKDNKAGLDASGRVIVFKSQSPDGKLADEKMGVWGRGHYLNTDEATVPGSGSSWYAVAANPLFVNGVQQTILEDVYNPDGSINDANKREVTNTIYTTAKKLGLKAGLDTSFIKSVASGENKVVADIIMQAAERTAAVNPGTNKSDLARAYAMALGYDSVRFRKVNWSSKLVNPAEDTYSNGTLGANAKISDDAKALMNKPYRVPTKEASNGITDGIVVFDKANLISANGSGLTAATEAYAFSEEDINNAWREAASAVSGVDFSETKESEVVPGLSQQQSSEQPEGRKSSQHSTKHTEVNVPEGSAISQTFDKMIKDDHPTPEMVEEYIAEANETGSWGLHEVIGNSVFMNNAQATHAGYPDIDTEFADWQMKLQGDNVRLWRSEGLAWAVVMHSALVAEMNKTQDVARKADLVQMDKHVVGHIIAIGTDAARTTQGMKMLGLVHKSPATILYTATQWMKLKEKQFNARSKRHITLTMDPMIAEQISSSDPEIAKDGLEALASYVATSSPKNMLDKVNAYRMLAMLSAPPTYIRNGASNALNQVNAMAKGKYAGLLEDVFDSKLDKRNASLKQSLKFTASDAIRADWEAMNGFIWSRSHSEYIIARAEANGSKYFDAKSSVKQATIGQLDQMFQSKVKPFEATLLGNALNKVSDMEYEALGNSDTYGLKGLPVVGKFINTEFGGWMSNYRYAFLNKARANGYTTEFFNQSLDPQSPDYKDACNALAECDEYAIKEADKATYHISSKEAQWINEAKNWSTLWNVGLNTIMPFTKTPINVAKASMQYSPLSFAKALEEWANLKNKGAKYSDYDLNSILDRLASGATGSQLFVLGAILAKSGILVASGDDDDENRTAFNEQMGTQKYAVRLFNSGSYTIDWATPPVIALMMGVEFFNSFDKMRSQGGEVQISLDDAFRAIEAMEATTVKSLSPMLEMSFMSSVNDILTAGKYENNIEDSVSAGIRAGARSYVSSFVPTALSKIKQSFDQNVYSTYAPKDSGMLGGANNERMLRQIENKIPFLNQALTNAGKDNLANAPKIDALGNAMNNDIIDSGSPLLDLVGNAAYAMLSPGYWRPDSEMEISRHLDEVFAETHNDKIYPKNPANNFSESGNDYVYNNREYSNASIEAGHAKKDAINEFFSSDLLDRLTPDQKAEVLTEINTYGDNLAKDKYLKSIGSDWEKNEKGKYKSSSKTNLDKTLNAVESGLSVGEYLIIKKLLDDIDNNKKGAFMTSLGLSFSQQKLFK